MSSTNGYGTLGHNSGPNGGSSDHDAPAAREDAPLLGPSSKDPHQHPVLKRFRKHMAVDVDNRHGDLILLLCYVITGLLDSSAVFIWGSFVSMQTGNTVYLGLGLVEPAAGTRWIKSGSSIGFFCLGSLFFSRFHGWLSPRKRWVLSASFGLQMLLIVAAAVIVTLDVGKEGDLSWKILVPLSLVAFQSSGQAVTSRALQFNSLTSVVLTSIYCDLFSDPDLFTKKLTENAERNRRASAPVCLLVGSLFGGLWAHSSIGLAGALWMAAALKFLVVLAWLMWASRPEAP